MKYLKSEHARARQKIQELDRKHKKLDSRATEWISKS
jgi:hypothetical protein